MYGGGLAPQFEKQAFAGPRLRPRHRMGVSRVAASCRAGIGTRAPCLSKSCSLEKPLVLVSCFSLAPVKGGAAPAHAGSSGHLLGREEEGDRVGSPGRIGAAWVTDCVLAAFGVTCGSGQLSWRQHLSWCGLGLPRWHRELGGCGWRGHVYVNSAFSLVSVQHGVPAWGRGLRLV